MEEQTTERITRIDTTTSRELWAKQAVDLLLEGGLVAFPTETVYGLAACPAVPGAIERLDHIKGRPSDKPYTVHIAYPHQLNHYVDDPPWLARILAKKGWPGPITLIIEVGPMQREAARERFGENSYNLFSDNTIGLRCPDHPVATMLLANCPETVVAPSANPSGQPPAFDADQVHNYFAGNKIDLILDAGPTRYRSSSTVVYVNDKGLKVLRAGPVDAASIDRLAKFNILFVCTGNTCRSPMAEALCKKMLADRLTGGCVPELADLKISVSSAGTFAAPGQSACAEAIEAMKSFSIDQTGHRTQAVTVDLVNQADMIFAMTSDHKDFISNLVPGAENRIQLIDREGNVSDPLGQPVESYLRCAQRLARAIGERLKELFE
jgi:protein-tyrosine phosphatase